MMSMSETPVPVVISGAGPNGLMLACELALAGVRPVVLERLPAPSDEPKANGMVGQVVRLLDMRGLYQRFSGSDEPPRPLYEWIFSGMSVPLFGMRDNPMYALMMSQPRLVRQLDERARGLGVDVRWGHELIGVESRSDGVKVSVSTSDETYELDVTYLVGADGGRSIVRKMAGIDFPGHTSTPSRGSPTFAFRTKYGPLVVVSMYPGLGRCRSATTDSIAVDSFTQRSSRIARWWAPSSSMSQAMIRSR
jgi:2-polyprenyl-6-methoxyphenol hydroxylase-like FAD-dependent oxidoreductase